MTTRKKPQMTPPTHGKLVAPEQYRAHYDPLSGFESVCSLARQRRNLEFLAATRPRRIKDHRMAQGQIACAEGLRRRDQPGLDRQQAMERAGIGHRGQNQTIRRGQGDGGGQQDIGCCGFVQKSGDQNGVKAIGRPVAQAVMAGFEIALHHVDPAIRPGCGACGGDEIGLGFDHGPAFEIK